MTTACAPTAHDLLFDDPREQGAFTRTQPSAGGDTLAVSQLRVGGITCAACAPLIEQVLLGCDGVLAAQVSASAERAEVRWDPHRTRLSALIAALRAAGYDAVPDLAAPARALREREQRRSLWRLFVAGFCMMQVMMYAAPAYVAAPGDIPADLLRLLQWASWLLTLPVLLFSADALWRGAFIALRQRRISMELPVVLGLAVGFVASSAATFDPGGLFGSAVYFDSLTMFVFLLLGGRELERRARHRAAAALEALTGQLPDSAQRRNDDGSATTVALRDLRIGDRIQLGAGQTLPADGELLDDAAEVSEALLTGESRPLHKRPGDALLAGSVNGAHALLMRVQRLGADTRHAAIAALVQQAFSARPNVARLADRCAAAFLWAVLLLAAGAAAWWSRIDPAHAVSVAVAVLIVTCPCAFSLAAPAVWLAATGALAKRGVLLRRIDALEPLSRIDTLLLDKTGTVTDDRMALAGIALLDGAETRGLDAAALLPFAAGLASRSTHPLARSLAGAAVATCAAAEWRDVVETPGCGIEGTAADGRRFRLGAATWVGVAVPTVAQGDDSADAGTWFGPVGQPWVRFAFAEALRPDAASAVQRLRAAGLDVQLLSGDSPAQVAAVGRALGITDARGGCSPQDKLDAMARLQAQGRVVAMVGDGSNDAPVLARADISFAFAHGAALAQQQADALLLHGRLGEVADAVLLARRALRIVRQNLAWAALYNAACVPLALAGALPPWAAGIGMAGSSLAVVLNALRASRLPRH